MDNKGTKISYTDTRNNPKVISLRKVVTVKGFLQSEVENDRLRRFQRDQNLTMRSYDRLVFLSAKDFTILIREVLT